MTAERIWLVMVGGTGIMKGGGEPADKERTKERHCHILTASGAGKNVGEMGILEGNSPGSVRGVRGVQLDVESPLLRWLTTC